MAVIGLKRGTVMLCPHEKEWESEAQRTITLLSSILGDAATDIQHVGSTSVPSIAAKPIIDIAVAAVSFDAVLAHEKELREAGFYYRPGDDMQSQRLFACGSYYNGTGDMQTHFIHVVPAGSMEWINYINFRDYLNKTPSAASEYEKLKLSLAAAAPVDAGREKYLKGKHDFIVYTLRKALVDSYLGKTVTVKIDRPIGYVHKKPKYTLTYPINYGYIPGVLGGDGEELDVYVLGTDKPLDEFTGRVIGIIHRENDVEDKLVAAPAGMVLYQNEIAEAVNFQEQYYKTDVQGLYQKSCGAILYRKTDKKTEYLLLFQKRSQTWSFPKGHMEIGETEEQTARREVLEETGLKAVLLPDFRKEVFYQLDNLINRKIVLFLSEVFGEPAIPENEIKEYRWVAANEAKLLLYPEYAKLIDEVSLLVM